MSIEEATHTLDSESTGPAEIPRRHRIALVLVWSARESHRIGEAVMLPAGTSGVTVTLGRGEGPSGDLAMRASLARFQPGRTQDTGPIVDPRISRRQALLTTGADDRSVRLSNVGRCPMLVDGKPVQSAELQVGDVVQFRSANAWLVTRRQPPRPPKSFPGAAFPPFGEADSHGVVGESPVAWALRDDAAFLARRQAHVLVRGDSGSGKELVARTIHALSRRGGRPLIARNAATIPTGLVDAELFGNIKDYPNPGMRDRPGLLGEADGSTLFLDEISEVPEEVQAHLLRVLDGAGEYHRLGESHARRADFRLLAATNRGLSALKHDLLARLKLRIKVPGLNERREDVPLLIRHLIRRTAVEDPEIGRRFLDDDGQPRVDVALVERLVRHDYTHHVRELEVLLWRAIATSDGDRVELTAALLEDLAGVQSGSRRSGASDLPQSVNPRDLTRQDVEVALARNGGVLKDTWPDLGLRNRFQLIRLMKKHGLK